MNYLIPCPNGRAKRACIKESMNYVKHGKAHTTSILESNCFASQWHVGRLPPSISKKCWAMQANIWILCNVEVGIGKHDIVAPTYKGLKNKYVTPTI